MNIAIIETGGKQYLVSPEDKIKIEKITTEDGKVVFDKVLLVAKDGAVKIGAPFVEGAKVEGNVLKQGRAKKIIVFRYHSKTRYRKKKGHRQRFSEVEIIKI
ncbi:MAG: 50S ribosomal protein L21 [bacterium]|nr:50S ribosomal protein L21 [bacterium]